MIKFLDLNAQYKSIKDDIDAAIARIISRSAFIGGSEVSAFEEEFAVYLNAKNVISVGNGTDALEIALEALELPVGSEVIVPANSFIASSEAVTRAGLKVVFADVNLANYTFDVQVLEQYVTDNTSAIMPVHLYGHPTDMDTVMGLARKHGLKVIEDCAQAHGATYKGKMVGTIGDLGTFSFYPGKNLGAYGDGGAITCMDDSIAERCRKIANHGRLAKYDHDIEGRNSRLDGLQAAILRVKLRHLESWTEHRIQVADWYLSGLRGLDDVALPVRSDAVRQVYHLFVIRTTQRDSLKAQLAEKEIQTGIHYPIALPALKAYDYLNQAGQCPNAVESAGTLLSLPIGEHLSEANIDFVVDTLRRWAERNAA